MFWYIRKSWKTTKILVWICLNGFLNNKGTDAMLDSIKSSNDLQEASEKCYLVPSRHILSFTFFFFWGGVGFTTVMSMLSKSCIYMYSCFISHCSRERCPMRDHLIAVWLALKVCLSKSLQVIFSVLNIYFFLFCS